MALLLHCGWAADAVRALRALLHLACHAELSGPTWPILRADYAGPWVGRSGREEDEPRFLLGIRSTSLRRSTATETLHKHRTRTTERYDASSVVGSSGAVLPSTGPKPDDDNSVEVCETESRLESSVTVRMGLIHLRDLLCLHDLVKKEAAVEEQALLHDDRQHHGGSSRERVIDRQVPSSGSFLPLGTSPQDGTVSSCYLLCMRGSSWSAHCHLQQHQPALGSCLTCFLSSFPYDQMRRMPSNNFLSF